MMRVKGTNNGFSLVEVLIALTILSVGILAVTGLAGSAAKSSGNSRAMTQATNVAMDRIEALASVPFANIQATDTVTARTDLRRACAGPGGPVNRLVFSCVPTTNQITIGIAPDTKAFTWTYTVTLIDLDGNGAAVEGDNLKRIDVTVQWQDPISMTTKNMIVATMRTKD